jgi:glyoxylase-like metal-dependent hydrolase (beta-lactamase superfamily II)
MQLHSIHSGNFKLDGGAMFGVVPKSLWQRTNPADDNNLCLWAMRLLLIETERRLILIDTGIGNKQDQNFLKHYHLFGETNLDSELKKIGVHRNDITDVFLTHLHFDHCGGALELNSNGNPVPSFKNAVYWSNERHWQWATQPNAREKASFLKENILPLHESGQLRFIPRSDEVKTNWLPNIDVLFVDGHTDSQMLPLISQHGKKILYTADLLPSTGHIPLAWVMGYDTRPLITLDEKKRILEEAAREEWVFFLEHDFYNECCLLEQSEKGIRLKEAFPLSTF